MIGDDRLALLVKSCRMTIASRTHPCSIGFTFYCDDAGLGSYHWHSIRRNIPARGTDRIRRADDVLVLESELTERSRDKPDASIACLWGTHSSRRYPHDLSSAQNSRAQHNATCSTLRFLSEAGSNRLIRRAYSRDHLSHCSTFWVFEMSGSVQIATMHCTVRCNRRKGGCHGLHGISEPRWVLDGSMWLTDCMSGFPFPMPW